ncbi:DUF3769 domain-containing protein [Prochlorococcus marinus XMU1408]|uniref:DUF3769 domain-containing protein n=2 Tax=Prochlorococcus marinus TaxID=1219 RepID=A0A318QY80_PROMR|nr:DUF3769 domain-containing protein [Prochlorococcus marinus str. XMU1408]PYE02487.1 DUF3769 domain-containing protein [Prochlorococcus marinus XMU1408]
MYLLSLGFLGLVNFLSIFDAAIGKENFYRILNKDENYNFSVGSLAITSQNLTKENLKLENKENIFLTLKVLSDKQYDYDQDLYLAEGNVKAIINGGILRSDILSYEKSTGILFAEGNIRFIKGGQYFRGEEFRFNLLKKEGTIKDSYGILDIENVLDDLTIHSNREITIENNRSINKLKSEEKTTYKDGLEFSLGNIKVPQNKITRSNKSIGAINNWRFKSDLISIKENGWKSNKIIFTNDPFDPHQISFEGIDVIAEEDDEKLIITSSKTNLILERRTKIYLGKRIFGREKSKKNKFQLILDSQDRDGLVLIRKSNSTEINNNIQFEFQPQFLINRAILGKTNSYRSTQSEDNKRINFFDLFGLNMKIYGNYKDWNFESLNDFSTLNTNRILKGIRHSSSIRKYFKMPVMDDSSFNIFTTYRSRAWNGTIGETEIKSAYGGFIEKSRYFKVGELRNNFNLKFGIANYEAEKLSNTEMISLWRSSIFSSLDSEYEMWKPDHNNLSQNNEISFSPVLINPELVFRSNINSAYYKYEDGRDQIFIKFSIGPEIRLGKLERKFLDYTKLSIMPGVKIKAGNSPFKFDNAIDLKTLNISFMQQVYGPLIFDIDSNLNIDKNSKNYGEYYDTKLGLILHKRAYEFGIYYHPNNEAGALYFRLNGFNFDNSVKAIF